MGITGSSQRNSRFSVASDVTRANSIAEKPTTHNKNLREHKRYGVVVVKFNSTAPNRRNTESQVSHVVTPKGAILYGSLFNPTGMQRAISSSGYPLLTPGELAIPDSRAHRLLVTYSHGWHLIPFPEVFSRHSGTCFVVGDRSNVGVPFQIKVGDCFRLGSVGLVVSEMKLTGQEEQKLDAKTLQFLKDEALAFDANEDNLAGLASDEITQQQQMEQQQAQRLLLMQQQQAQTAQSMTAKTQHFNNNNNSSFLMDHGDNNSEVNSVYAGKSVVTNDDDISHYNNNLTGNSPVSPGTYNNNNEMGSGGIVANERFFCYMCYESHNSEEDPLIAPCDCKGDTRFLHVQCLQKWYHSSALGHHAQVIRTTGNGAPACKICGSAYKTLFRRHDGRKASILELESDGPYLSLVVVTHHDTNPGLFNTKFRLNFGRMNNNTMLTNANTMNGFDENDGNSIVIGRSSSCTMILDYRTVSTVHAKIHYSNGRFYLSDNRSSNGTLVYIQDPLPLPYSIPVKIRMGRTTITLQAKRSWSAAMRSFFFGHPSSAATGQGNGQGGSNMAALAAHHHNQQQQAQQDMTNNSDMMNRESMDGQQQQQFDYSSMSSAVPSPMDIQEMIGNINNSLLLASSSEGMNMNNHNNNTNTSNNNTANNAANNTSTALDGGGMLAASAPPMIDGSPSRGDNRGEIGSNSSGNNSPLSPFQQQQHTPGTVVGGPSSSGPPTFRRTMTNRTVHVQDDSSASSSTVFFPSTMVGAGASYAARQLGQGGGGQQELVAEEEGGEGGELNNHTYDGYSLPTTAIRQQPVATSSQKNRLMIAAAERSQGQQEQPGQGEGEDEEDDVAGMEAAAAAATSGTRIGPGGANNNNNTTNRTTIMIRYYEEDDTAGVVGVGRGLGGNEAALGGGGGIGDGYVPYTYGGATLAATATAADSSNYPGQGQGKSSYSNKAVTMAATVAAPTSSKGPAAMGGGGAIGGGLDAAMVLDEGRISPSTLLSLHKSPTQLLVTEDSSNLAAAIGGGGGIEGGAGDNMAAAVPVAGKYALPYRSSSSASRENSSGNNSHRLLAATNNNNNNNSRPGSRNGAIAATANTGTAATAVATAAAAAVMVQPEQENTKEAEEKE